jgi:transglutaminase-like putative cysteine protease
LRAGSEVALLAVHLAVVGGFARLFEDASFVGPLAGFTIAASALAVVARRRRFPVPAVLLLAVLGAGVAATWFVFPSSARWSLPTRASWDLAGQALQLSRSRFEEVAAPAPVTPGFVLASGLALWFAVWFADWAAFRLRATAEAVAPAAVLFVFGALLGSGDHRLTSAVGFGAAVLVFVAAHRALRAQLEHPWLASSPSSAPRAVLRAGVGLAVVGLLVGAVAGPRLPGSEAEALVRWRSESRGGGDRSTVSPIVDLRARLVNQSDAVVFTVDADRPAYWRLTALDRFDGQLWSSGGEFSPASGRLGDGGAIEPSRRNRQRFEISSLAAIWAPSAYRPRGLMGTSEPMRWDVDSSTLIVEAEGTTDGMTYELISEAPSIGPVTLGTSGDQDPRTIERRYGALPPDFPELAAETARRATAGARTRYEQALALQEHFRNGYTYSLDVEAGHGDEALVDFLTRREGYCEQFAGAYAAMARSLGIPSRVAVGFTPGERDPDDPERYTVRGRHAHAWPELWFPDVGWVPFEPTPGRGMPDATSYTGVPEQQDDTPAGGGAETTTTTTTPDTASTTVPGPDAAEDTIPRNPTVLSGSAPETADGPTGSTRAAVAIALGIGSWLVVVLAAPLVRRRRRRGDRSAAGVLTCWRDALAPVRWLTGLRPRPAETHLEFAERAGPSLGDLGGHLRELAALATAASWDPAGAGDADADRAATLAATLADAARARQGPLAKVRRRLSWREAFDRPKPVLPATSGS